MLMSKLFKTIDWRLCHTSFLICLLPTNLRTCLLRSFAFFSCGLTPSFYVMRFVKSVLLKFECFWPAR